MQRISFKVGLAFIAKNIRHMIRRRLATDKIQLESDSGEITNLSDAELLQRWQTGDWVIDEKSLSSLGNVIYQVVPRDLATYPECHQKSAMRRLKYLQAVDPEARPYNDDVWLPLIQDAAAQMKDRFQPCGQLQSQTIPDV